MSAKSDSNANSSKNIVICISGMAGTGKSTLSKKIAKKYDLKYYSGGDALKEIARQNGYKVDNEGWWENPAGLNFLEERMKDPKFDKMVDEQLIKFAKKGNVLLDSWTMPWLLNKGYKIWLMASLEKRAARVAERDKMSVDNAFKVLKEKEDRTKAIYRDLYGFKLDEDYAPFDLVLDTDNLNAEQVFQVLCNIMDTIVLPKSKQ